MSGDRVQGGGRGWMVQQNIRLLRGQLFIFCFLPAVNGGQWPKCFQYAFITMCTENNNLEDLFKNKVKTDFKQKMLHSPHTAAQSSNFDTFNKH